MENENVNVVAEEVVVPQEEAVVEKTPVEAPVVEAEVVAEPVAEVPAE